jgi:acyl carrier protein
MNSQTQVDIQEKIKEIIISVADVEIDKETIAAGKNSLNDIGLNSLNTIKMMVEIEKEFDIEIDFDEITPEVWSSLEHLSDYILNLK